LRINEHLDYKIEPIKVDFQDVFISEDLIIQDNFKFDFFNCKICFSVVRDPISCNFCEDLFCSFCLDICLNKKNRCPHCRGSPFYKRKINKNLKNILNEIDIKCPLFCNEIFKYKNLEKHLNLCTMLSKIYICNLCSYHVKVEENDLKQVKIHNDECPEILYKCPDCKKNFNKRVINEHMTFCEEKLFKCLNCSLKIPKKFSNSHKEFYCKLLSELNKKFEYFFEKYKI